MHTAFEKSNTDSLNSPIPIYDTVAKFRKWRTEVGRQGNTVGFVPTMGALHEGHLGLGKWGLHESPETLLIYDNPNSTDLSKGE